MKAALLIWCGISFLAVGSACFAMIALLLARVWWRGRARATALHRQRAEINHARGSVWLERGVRR